MKFIASGTVIIHNVQTLFLEGKIYAEILSHDKSCDAQFIPGII